MKQDRTATMPPQGWKKDPDKKKPRHREQVATFYLGNNELREKRIGKLDELAAEIGAENRSNLLQLIADGQIQLVRKASASP